MAKSIILQGELIWSGEHWINYLRPTGEQEDSAQISLYRTMYSKSGEGIVTFINIKENSSVSGIYTDNRRLVPAIKETMIQGKVAHFDREMPVFDAVFNRSGSIQESPSWIIQSETTHMISTWADLKPPLVIEKLAPDNTDFDLFSILFFAEAASISINNTAIEGNPYSRDIWKPYIGGQRSSCVFALAETMTSLK